MYKYLHDQRMNIEVWYCDDSSIHGGLDKQFGQSIAWDVPLLEGYSYKFFPNQSWNPSPGNGFWGIVNFNLLRIIWKSPKSIYVINGWQFFTYVSATLLAFVKGSEVWMRCEMPLNQEMKKTDLSRAMKRWFLKSFYFKLCTKFLYIGTENENFYKYLGINKSKLFFTPYSVDNDRFSKEADHLIGAKNLIKSKLDIPEKSRVILFSGKYIEKKRPLDLMQAYQHCNVKNKYLIFLGDGELREKMETYAKDFQLKNVLLTGFINQSEVSKYYAIADLFVMCSSYGETWGLSINEAMNFSLPIIVSDAVGSAIDLVRHGENGYIYPVGDVNRLTQYIDKVFASDQFEKLAGASSKKIVDQFSYSDILVGLKQALKNP
ncbi:MAG: glycosyltransferase [Saprospiraceae bacterium]|nr:glycosyltransferase [Saprospiraceae bacterium]